eukprot:jgi/Picsp_1/4037/NSC_01548-R1_protein
MLRHAFRTLIARQSRLTFGKQRKCSSWAVSSTFEGDSVCNRLSSDDSVEYAVQVGCARLGRNLTKQHEEDMRNALQLLRNNWYTSASDVVAMSDEEAISLGFPLKLKIAIADALEDIGDAKKPGIVESDRSEEPGPCQEEISIDLTPIEERVCPPLNRFGFKYVETPKVSTRSKITKYALSKAELTDSLTESFNQLMKFGTERFYGAQSEPIAIVTAEKYADHLRAMLGWVHSVQGVELDQLSFEEHIVPSADRDGVKPAFDYIQWLVKERKIAVRTELLVLRSVLHAAKFIHHSHSKIRPNSGETPYADLDVVKEVRALINTRRKASKIAPRVADEKVKWLDWPEYIKLCDELRKECAALKQVKNEIVPRPDEDTAWSVQRYLIFAILSCCPDRQRTLRELELGRTLIKEDGKFIIRHSPDDYKTGKSYGERAPLLIAESIYPELEGYISKWRSYLSPQHDFLFTQANGKPFTDKSLYKLFRTTAYRISGKRLTPHMVRDAVITHLRGSNASEKELEALAIYMGHSITIQKSTYDRRTKLEKVEPAIKMLSALRQ